MSPVKTLIGCLVVMGAVQAKEGNGGPPQDPPPDGQGIPPQVIQSSEQGVEIYPQQLQHKRLPPFKQHQQQQRKQQHGLRRRKTKDNGQAMFDTTSQLLNTFNESTEQVKLIQQKSEALQQDQLNYLTQLQLAGVSVILITLTLSVLIQKLLSQGQQSNQRTIQILQTDGKETVPQLNTQSLTEQRQSKYQQVQITRLPRSTSAVPWGQSVDILKTLGIQTRTAQLLSGIITQLQATATESATTACKHRLLDTCAGGLRAAALC